ncbi:sigma-70 family RNA polymerase sigma factor [Pendulispora brunnea]|uniref:Sigma-70 family RNA polymerase sigma factor n=1 Tax=Pendulispora brunnea TaxID=2905690 RepID=A0ABZ2KGD5_9BACT
MGVFAACLQSRGVTATRGWDAVERQFDAMFAAAMAAWPTVRVEADVFAQYVGARLPENGAIEEALAALHGADLYLACACASGDTGAIGVFDGAMRDVAEGTLARFPGARLLGDDTRQVLCAKLFVSEGGTPPRIAEYSGRGSLRGWFRVALSRQILSAIRATKREVALDEDALALTPASSGDPELSHLRRRFSSEFAQAFASAMRALESSERNVLRHHYIDGLSIDEIGAIYRIHRVTAARRLTRAREALVAGTRRFLAARLHASPSELRSAMRILDGAVDITLQRALRETGPFDDNPSSSAHSGLTGSK